MKRLWQWGLPCSLAVAAPWRTTSSPCRTSDCRENNPAWQPSWPKPRPTSPQLSSLISLEVIWNWGKIDLNPLLCCRRPQGVCRSCSLGAINQAGFKSPLLRLDALGWALMDSVTPAIGTSSSMGSGGSMALGGAAGSDADNLEKTRPQTVA